MHSAAVIVTALATVSSASPAPAPAPAPASGPSSLLSLREFYLPGSQLKAFNMDLANNAGQPRFSARFWCQFFDTYLGRRPAIRATVEEFALVPVLRCRLSAKEVPMSAAVGLGYGASRPRSPPDPFACVRVGVKAMKTNLERAKGRELGQVEAAAAAAALSLLSAS
ncbi:MAG: hypothetical protein M1826_004939 [Phylliscum demangeonii]|nr:MAG: hypothetical protein M1826_004939 [Phylliscum demangeonii]